MKAYKLEYREFNGQQYEVKHTLYYKSKEMVDKMILNMFLENQMYNAKNVSKLGIIIIDSEFDIEVDVDPNNHFMPITTLIKCRFIIEEIEIL